jgi:hypothetical protein
MRKYKEPANKDTVPSTTRRGTNLPCWPHFLPNVATTPAIKKKVVVQTSSPLSMMSIINEKDLLDGGKDKEGMLNLSKPLSNNDIESEYEEDEFYDECNTTLIVLK